MRAIEQYFLFHVVLVLFIMMYKVVITCKTVGLVYDS